MSSGASSWPIAASAAPSSAAVISSPSALRREVEHDARAKNHSSGSSSIVVARSPSTVEL